MAASRGDRHHDVIAGLEPRDAAPHFAHDPGALVAADHRKLALAQSRHLRQIGVAQAGGFDLDEDLALAGPFELELLDPERLAVDIGRRQALFVHHGGGHLHLACPRMGIT